jgi:hypothetical protein
MPKTGDMVIGKKVIDITKSVDNSLPTCFWLSGLYTTGMFSLIWMNKREIIA